MIPVQNGHFSLCSLFAPSHATTSGNDALSSPPDVVSQAGTKILAQRKMHFALKSLIFERIQVRRRAEGKEAGL
ncbi:MAG: hypothetical protein Q4A32_05870, partial [Lachnospiraceae bacterium]|nr:hypothetical protein [Lachnospiraceae bacterium]